MAAYIAKRDHIYDRMIFVPSTSLPLYPLSSDKHLVEYQNRVKRNMDVFGNYFTSDGKNALPFELLEQNIQTYLTEARHFFKFYIYEVSMQGLDPEAKPIVILMSDFLQIGINLEQNIIERGMARERKIPKSFKIEMEIKLMDNKEVVTGTVLKEIKNIYRLMICNIETKPDWMGPEPSPEMKYLDLSLLDVDGAKVFNQNSKLLQKGVKIPFEALHRNLRIHSASFKGADNELFHIIIDDNCYGPFNSFEVRPLELIQGKHFFLPVMSFSRPVVLT